MGVITFPVDLSIVKQMVQERMARVKNAASYFARCYIGGRYKPYHYFLFLQWIHPVNQYVHNGDHIFSLHYPNMPDDPPGCDWSHNDVYTCEYPCIITRRIIYDYRAKVSPDTPLFEHIPWDDYLEYKKIFDLNQ
jgi:hypothetical protein